MRQSNPTGVIFFSCPEPCLTWPPSTRLDPVINASVFFLFQKKKNLSNESGDFRLSVPIDLASFFSFFFSPLSPSCPATAADVWRGAVCCDDENKIKKP